MEDLESSLGTLVDAMYSFEYNGYVTQNEASYENRVWKLDGKETIQDSLAFRLGDSFWDDSKNKTKYFWLPFKANVDGKILTACHGYQAGPLMGCNSELLDGSARDFGNAGILEYTLFHKAFFNSGTAFGADFNHIGLVNVVFT